MITSLFRGTRYNPRMLKFWEKYVCITVYVCCKDCMYLHVYDQSSIGQIPH